MNRLGLGPMHLTRWRQVLARPFELGMAVYGIVGGLYVFADMLGETGELVPIHWLGSFTLLAIGVFLSVGGGFIIFGLMDVDAEDILSAWKSERTGLILSGTAWLVFAFLSATHAPGSVLGWFQPAMFAAAMWLRFFGTQQDEHDLTVRVNGDGHDK